MSFSQEEHTYDPDSVFPVNKIVADLIVETLIRLMERLDKASQTRTKNLQW